MNTHPNKTPEKPIELSEGLWLNKRQLSMSVAVLIALAFFTFMIGYFWGHKKAIEQLSYRLDQDSLADQVYSSMCGLYDNNTDSEEESENNSEQSTTSPQAETPSEASAVAEKIQEPLTAQPPLTSKSHVPRYHAQLAGFGTQAAAQRFADRLTKQGFPVRVDTRESSSAQGKKVTWFQVVTLPIERDALESMIEKIKKVEKLKGIRIITDR